MIDTTATELELQHSTTVTATPLNAGFRNLWTAAAASNLGDGVRAAALPLLATLVTRDPAVVGGLYFAGQLPWLILGLPAGAAVDRIDRRLLLAGTHTVRFAVVGTLLVAVSLGTPPLALLFAAALALGIAETVFDNAAQALLPAVVEPARLPDANGRLEVAYLVGNQFAGPALGAALFAVAAPAPFLLDAAALGVAAIAVARIRTPRVRRAPVVQERLRHEVVAGLRWLWAHPQLRSASIVAALVNVCMSGTLAVLALYALEVLRLPAPAIGILLSAEAVGGVVGGLAAGWICARIGRVGTISTAIAGASVAMLGLGTARTFVVAVAMQVLIGLTGSCWNVVTTSWRQSEVPDALLGRVIAAHRLLSWGGGAVGALIATVLATTAGLRAPFVAGGLLLVVVTLAAPLLFRSETDANAA